MPMGQGAYFGAYETALAKAAGGRPNRGGAGTGAADTCDKLHSQTEPTKSYANLRDWWNSSTQCEHTRVPGMLASPSLRVDLKNGK